VKPSAQIISISATPLSAICFWVPDKVLKLIFGDSYLAGAMPLTILAVGQLINAVSGPGLLLLNMTGHGRSVTIAIVAAVIINLIGNILVIPYFGVIAAAFDNNLQSTRC
jgi:O-antigen/teichoic acid export membrane protein